MGQDEKGRIIGGLDGTDDAVSLDCGADGGFDGGSDGFEPKQRNDNCKRRVDERRHRTRAPTRSSRLNPADSLTQMDFIMTSRKLEVKHVQVLDSDWFKTDHRRCLLSFR